MDSNIKLPTDGSFGSGGTTDWIQLELAALRSENEGLRAELKAIYPHSKCMDLEAKITALMEALEKYGNHNPQCPAYTEVNNVRPKCTCGYDSALAQAKGGE